MVDPTTGLPAGHHFRPEHEITPVDARTLHEAGDYVLVDVRATLSEIQVSEGLTARISAWGKNVFDEEYVNAGIDFGALGFGGANFGKPAMYGVDITFEY